VSAAAKPRFAPDPARRAALAKVHLAAKELGLETEDYRAVLVRVTGKSSAGEMTFAELQAVLDEFGRRGWSGRAAKPAAPRARPADHPSARKARALWISLWQLGAIESASEAGLEAFARRQLKCERMQWADQAAAYKLIEALKGIAARHGWEVRFETPALVVSSLIEAIHAKLAAIRPDAAGPDARWGTLWRREPMHRLYQFAQELGAELRRARMTGFPGD
jgi:phage gp16-like protein